MQSVRRRRGLNACCERLSVLSVSLGVPRILGRTWAEFTNGRCGPEARLASGLGLTVDTPVVEGFFGFTDTDCEGC